MEEKVKGGGVHENSLRLRIWVILLHGELPWSKQIQLLTPCDSNMMVSYLFKHQSDFLFKQPWKSCFLWRIKPVSLCYIFFIWLTLFLLGSRGHIHIHCIMDVCEFCQLKAFLTVLYSARQQHSFRYLQFHSNESRDSGFLFLMIFMKINCTHAEKCLLFGPLMHILQKSTMHAA